MVWENGQAVWTERTVGYLSLAANLQPLNDKLLLVVEVSRSEGDVAMSRCRDDEFIELLIWEFFESSSRIECPVNLKKMQYIFNLNKLEKMFKLGRRFMELQAGDLWRISTYGLLQYSSCLFFIIFAFR